MVIASGSKQPIFWASRIIQPGRIVRPRTRSKYLKCLSCFFAVIGGVLVASKTGVSSYGFLFLAMSSSLMLIASFWERDKSMMYYSGSIFFFVDCLGVYRWLLS